jgi:hypothetical protein
MAVQKTPHPHAHAAAAKVGVDLLSITSLGLKTAHWKQHNQGMDFPLPSTAQIDAHVDFNNESIRLHQGRPKSTKRKTGYMEKQAKKRIFTCQER